ncbi:50S ribosomal protein L24 [Dissulfurirhabdus thermomarina]|uniref:Large ribosomal subunit protein uL24 n=1 Tax=Dissulfurirhabdus thermomarina TaxID=1765737 RepID=A0A6N9TJQ6_DISTH|nr:50S ribosomal protein L24 [Dissulfurirhabdus thermomarina]NDY41319.1 50S ribosomal protein L24 [Dissulfurirhabdus thermomarina]NMX23298.1 50S ribosomal protein L24 [Dissulfurirhabdus thermomarina]
MKRVKTYLRKNDRVMVIAGKDKGKAGRILSILTKKGRATVEGVNIIKRHTRPGPGSQGGIIEKEGPVHLSNLMLICDKCTDPVRIRWKVLENGEKVRVCKKCGEVIATEAK